VFNIDLDAWAPGPPPKGRGPRGNIGPLCHPLHEASSEGRLNTKGLSKCTSITIDEVRAYLLTTS